MILQRQAVIEKSMMKFQKHFKSNLEKLKLAESEVKSGPKFANCFLDLTLFLGI